MNPDQQMNDHDLLITIHEQVKNVRSDIQALQDDSAVKILDHETRIRRLEMWGGMAIGGIAVIEAIIGWYLTIHGNGK